MLAYWLALAGVLAVISGCGLQATGQGAGNSATAVVSAGGGASPAVTAGVARQRLSALAVAAPGSMTGYSRAKFPHWEPVEGTCDTREEVLKRQGSGVVEGKDCQPTSGVWTSPYDGVTTHKPSDLDIDHLVPLGDAWTSGASSWTAAEREQFANDLTRPQLFAVTDNLNEQKGDKAPDAWKPPLTSFWCTYATDWITVKSYYRLSVTSSEEAALLTMLGHC